MFSRKKIGRRCLAALLALSLCLGPVVQANAARTNSSATAKTTAAKKTGKKRKTKKKLTPEQQREKELKKVYKMKIQSNQIKGWPKGPGTYGESGIVMDAGTGAILYAKNIDTHEYPASITKVLTALVALENGKMDDPVIFTKDCVSFIQPGDSSIGLKKGNKITLEQALYATLLASANEAAYAVGENVGKNAGHDYNWFVQQMNVRCKELGGNNSHFANTNGLHDPNHYTCARDMALIGRELFKHPEFFKIVQTLNYTIPKSKTVEKHEFYQKHKMLWPGNSKTDAEYTAAVDNGSYGNFVKDSAGYGLAQWTYWSRKQALLNHAKQAGVSIADLNMQLGFLWEELQGYTAVMDALKKAGSVRAASDAVLTGYEKPADQSETVKKKRAEYGEGYYKKYAAGNGTKYYRVRKSWTDAASQLGAFTSLENAKSACKAGYTVYDDNGKAVYTAAGQQASAGVPFSVQVDILDLNIRTGAGTNYAKTGETTGKGVFTIVEVKAGQGASAGWGRLKSGAGWISLDYATRLA